MILYVFAAMMLVMMPYNVLADDHIKQTSKENQHVILFSPLRLDNTTTLNFEPTLIGLILDQKDTITWINQDKYPFTINGKDGSWTTGKISPGKSGSVKFNATGIYEFTSDADFTKMAGIIAVVQSNEITFDNIDQRMEITEKILKKLGHTQVDLKDVFLDFGRKQVIVGMSADKFTDETPGTYYHKKLEDWIPFETRISIAINSGSDSEYSGFAGWSYETEWIKFHNDGDVIFTGKQFHALPLTDDLGVLGGQKITRAFHGINFQFYEKHSDEPNLGTITRVKMTFPNGAEEDIFVHPPMAYLNTEDKETLHPYFSSTTNHDLPVRPIILSLDDKTNPTYILIHKKDLSLTEQRMLGVMPMHMGCGPDLGRYLKPNGDLMCIQESTFFKILNRGYFDAKTVNGFDVNYYSDAIQIQDIHLDNNSNDNDQLSISIEKNNNKYGDLLTVSIPNELLYPKFHDEMLNEDRFGLLFDGKLSDDDDAYAWERIKTPSHRVLGLMIDNSTNTVTIIGNGFSISD
ncbi:MAG: hypothetical protein OEL56_02010 [Nitrosopumilus sp.]|nr:hypothetical protein [Nitrosopumilus sp.]